MRPIQPHPDHHELHGITVAVNSTGPELYVGRCHDMDATRIYLVDVDVFVEGSDQRSKREYLERVAKFGHWKKHDRLTLVRTEVAWIETLGNIAEHGPPAEGS